MLLKQARITVRKFKTSTLFKTWFILTIATVIITGFFYQHSHNEIEMLLFTIMTSIILLIVMVLLNFMLKQKDHKKNL